MVHCFEIATPPVPFRRIYFFFTGHIYLLAFEFPAVEKEGNRRKKASPTINHLSNLATDVVRFALNFYLYSSTEQ
jgi:hypothetical protein